MTGTGTAGLINGEVNLTFDGSLLVLSNSNAASHQFLVSQASTGDAAIQFRSNTPTYWTTGIDNSDSEAYVIANSTDLGTTNYIRLGGSSISFAQNVDGFSMGGSLNMDGSNIDMGAGDITEAGTITAQTLNAEEKNFDIPHPSKEGWRLRYSVLEGPERGVYVRGKVENNGIIELPDYWKDLVYEDSISVQLTPIGNSCTHYVTEVNSTQITINCACGNVNAYYVVFAERKHNEPVLVEYRVLS